MNTSPHKSEFVHVNGIRLHYLDWEGEGETLLFLTGMGCSAHLFDKIAPRFTDKFRVLALTRRGQGESDYPENGYDADTLIDDILDFMDSLKIEKSILAGHSMAGMELSHFAATYPERVTKLIYLDAAYDRRRMATFSESNPLKGIQPPNMKKEFSSIEEYIKFIKSVRPDLEKIWSEIWDESIVYELTKNANDQYVEKDTGTISKAMKDTLETYAPEDSQIKIPILSFFCIQDEPDLPNYLTAEQKSLGVEHYKKTWRAEKLRRISKFRDEVPHAKIVQIHNGHHYCFIAQEELVYDEMRKFLLQ